MGSLVMIAVYAKGGCSKMERPSFAVIRKSQFSINHFFIKILLCLLDK